VRIKAGHFLYAINIITALLFVIIAFFPNNVVRIILGLPAVLFFPGFTLLAALFPRKDNLSDIERFALTFGLSIAVVPLLTLALNYTPWGIRLYPILISLFIFIFTMSVIGLYRNRKLFEEERIALHLNIRFPSLSYLWSGQSLLDKIITVVLVVLVIGAVVTLVYVARQPRNVEKFTEFYILNDAGKVENYPGTIISGQNTSVILGIINHENNATTYRIDITLGGNKYQQIEPFILNTEEKREQAVTVTHTKTGDKQELEFLLYKGGSSDVYESLHLWADVAP
jgi:uncharacterized membrane protein